jgi:hypothetical protein
MFQTCLSKDLADNFSLSFPRKRESSSLLSKIPNLVRFDKPNLCCSLDSRQELCKGERMKNIKGTCPVCKGNIVEKTGDVAPPKPIIVIIGLHCEKCGISFAFLTPKSVLEEIDKQRKTS